MALTQICCNLQCCNELYIYISGNLFEAQSQRHCAQCASSGKKRNWKSLIDERSSYIIDTMHVRTCPATRYPMQFSPQVSMGKKTLMDTNKTIVSSSDLLSCKYNLFCTLLLPLTLQFIHVNWILLFVIVL